MSILFIVSNAYSCAEIIEPIFVSLPDTKFLGLDSSSLEGSRVEAEIRVLSSGSIEVIEILSMEPDHLDIEKVKRMIGRAKFIPAQVRISGGDWGNAEAEIKHIFQL